jgi:low affinity Fe/Cu permease
MRKQDQDETPTTPARGGAVHAINHFLEHVARKTTLWVGGNWAFAIAVCVVLAWLLSGPLFHYSDTWQLVINTSTTIVTFLMVFLIQRSQNKEARAMQLKLNEIVAALEGASNHLIDAEDFTEEELEVLAEHYRVLVKMIGKDISITQSHSIKEAERRHHEKRAQPKSAPAKPAGG